VVVDRLVIKPGIGSRLAESVAVALHTANDTVIISAESPAPAHSAVRSSDFRPPASHLKSEIGNRKSETGWVDHLFSSRFACPVHPEVSLSELSPRLFSFNSPHGACPMCGGLGNILEFDESLVVADPSLSLAGGAIEPWRQGRRHMAHAYARLLD